MRFIMSGQRNSKTLTDILIAQAEIKGQLTQISINLGERVKEHDTQIDTLFSKYNVNDRRVGIIESKVADIANRMTGSFTRTMAVITSIIGGTGIIITIITLATQG